MTASLFERTLARPAMLDVFADGALVAAMLAFESALAETQAALGAIPASAVGPIAAACATSFDVEAIVAEARLAGSFAIPLVQRLTARVAERDAGAAGFVHRGSTSQDVIDTAMALVTQRALALLDDELVRLTASLLALARRHLATPILARTLMQPAQVVSFGFKLVAWIAPLVRARSRLAAAGRAALKLQLGGAVGTLATLGDAGPAVARSVADRLGLALGEGAWHTQRDEWVGLGCEVALLCGSLGKVGRDLALLAQGEVGEVAEPAGAGRGGSSAMPQKRNPVAAMVALAAATRAPHHAAALLSAMGQEHERGLGGWQAELAEWPALFIAAHGSVASLADAAAGLEVDTRHMRANIERQHGAVFSEAAAAVVAVAVGKSAAHALLARLAAQAASEGGELLALLTAALTHDPALAAVDVKAVAVVFDIDAAARRAAAIAAPQLDRLEARLKITGDQP
jgi:3-carboxy-cis,cis-muconate cycloisomerase